MSLFQRIKSILAGVFILIAAVILFFIPEEAYLLIPPVLGISLLFYGIHQLWYYFRMAKHMVGGKSVLFRGIIAIDVALFTSSISSMNSRFIVLIYLLGIYAFTGAVDVLRAFEAKNNGSNGWQLKLTRGIIGLIFSVALFIIGFIIGRTDIFVYGYCFSLAYSAIMRFVAAFKRTAVVYIQ